MLTKLFANHSLLFLKAKPNNLRRTLEIVQLFATTSSSQCNFEKSQLISLMESDGFAYARWMGEVVKDTNLRHLAKPLGYQTTRK